MLNFIDEQETLVGYADVMERFRKSAFDFRLSRCNVENVKESI